jgi:transcriptional regulator with XRE-family HTH domain
LIVENTEDEYPPCAANLRRLRESAGLSVEDVAEVIGLNCAWVWDLESYDDELYSTISLAAILRLAVLLRTGIAQLLLLEDEHGTGTRVAFKDFVEHLQASLRAKGRSADAFGDEVGWDLTTTLDDPREIWEWSPEELRDVAAGLQVNWVAALPTADDTPPPLEGGGPILN